MNFKTERVCPNVLRVDFTGIKTGWEQWVLVRSDVHWDNPECRRDMELKHLREAKERNAGIIDAGDLFCAMQGKFDKRSDKSSLRPEHQVGDYLDALVRTAADYYQPYAKNILVLGQGNHEVGILRHHETNLTERLAATINDRERTSIPCLGYTGWVWFSFEAYGARTSRVLWYTHGYGGGGPVTQDVIQSNRQMVYIENADIMMSGHVHRSWQVDYVRHKINQAGLIERRDCVYIKTPTYKDAYGDGSDGAKLEVRCGMGPRPLGAWWIRFFYESNKKIKFDVVRAK